MPTNDSDKRQKNFSWRQVPDIVTKVLDNRYVSVLIILILVALFILLLSQISFVFTPFIDFLQTIMLPVILAGVLYYLTSPISNALRKRGLSSYAIAGIVLLILALIVVWLFSFIPRLLADGRRLLSNWSSIWRQYQYTVETIASGQWLGNRQELIDLIDNLNLDQLQFNWKDLMNTTIASIGSIVGVISRITIALISAPIILFYLIADGERFKKGLAKLIPVRLRAKTMQLLSDMNQQISGYIRGQIFVAIAVAIMFTIGYHIIGLNYGTILAVVAGALNVIPYVGSAVGLLPSLIVGLVQDPIMMVKVLMVFAVEQTIESRLISPLILGSNLNIHPVTIMLLLISGGDLFGVVGIIIIIPVYAVLKVVVRYAFEWYRQVSGLYEEDLEDEEQSLESLPSSKQEN
ncbi:AI-2E family transporter [Aerococcus christensenii]|uniref:AI-2E family transporter n=1 Tax=Aerococcus christensenii TaxID=87541 RepID=UPI000762ED2E|nr:AI-2E family transporter [Aerococcus christensenii]AMB92760.1 hypothetical protein AWM71_05480 [Aerococcus christensenii]